MTETDFQKIHCFEFWSFDILIFSYFVLRYSDLFTYQFIENIKEI